MSERKTDPSAAERPRTSRLRKVGAVGVAALAMFAGVGEVGSRMKKAATEAATENVSETDRLGTSADNATVEFVKSDKFTEIMSSFANLENTSTVVAMVEQGLEAPEGWPYNTQGDDVLNLTAQIAALSTVTKDLYGSDVSAIVPIDGVNVNGRSWVSLEGIDVEKEQGEPLVEDRGLADLEEFLPDDVGNNLTSVFVVDTYGKQFQILVPAEQK